METIRWGILGCGDIAQKRVADAIRRDSRSQLVAACRRDVNRLGDFCRRFDVPHAIPQSADLFRSTEIDAVYVATPVHLHRQNVLEAAAAGKHILVEKPMALNAVECDEMVAACTNSGVTLSVAYYRRFYPIVNRIKELIASGELGKPLSVSATTGNPTLFPDSDWRVVLAQGGGGPLMDIGSHRIDLFLDMFGPVANVKSCVESIGSTYESEDTAVVMLKFVAGPVGLLQTYFGATDVPDQFSVLCTNGSMATSSLNDGELLIRRAGSVSIEQHPPDANLHAPLIVDFTEAIADGRPPVVTGEQGADVNRVIDLAYAES